ncbi:MAG: hypothetical protein F2667_05935 [Actinobacteria bacterium]|uniref:Unannotated protein n=1 Tax=freshwater metagenome TaxID=449393 RepID=A0A6J6Q1Q7_9ZZZZ|nr:hypothetical protein [Actinomycetota bacterium]
MRMRIVVAATAAAVLVVVALAVVVGRDWWQERERTELERAVRLVPSDTERYSWTDWTGVRRALDTDLTVASTGEEVRAFLADGFEADLTSTSALVDSGPVLQDSFGWSPATVDWELFAQGEDGSADLVHLSDSVDLDDVTDRLVDLGYERPSSDDGIWAGGEQVLAQIELSSGGTLTPTLQYVAVDAEQRLLAFSDNVEYLPTALAALGEPQGRTVDEVVAAVADTSPVSAAIYSGDFACRGLAMAQADEDDQQLARDLIARAGPVNAMTGFAMVAEQSGHLRVAMSFESDDQAEVNADTRAVLAAGPAVGQGGDFADRFEVLEVSSDGPVVTLELDPVPDVYVLSDLSTGPLLFATC